MLLHQYGILFLDILTRVRALLRWREDLTQRSQRGSVTFLGTLDRPLWSPGGDERSNLSKCLKGVYYFFSKGLMVYIS